MGFSNSNKTFSSLLLFMYNKQGQQGPQKLSSFKSLVFQNPPKSTGMCQQSYLLRCPWVTVWGRSWDSYKKRGSKLIGSRVESKDVGFFVFHNSFSCISSPCGELQHCGQSLPLEQPNLTKNNHVSVFVKIRRNPHLWIRPLNKIYYTYNTNLNIFLKITQPRQPKA